MRWLREHPRAADVVLALLVATLSVLIHLTVREPDRADPSAIGVLTCLIGAVPLAWRRRAPEVVLAVVLAAQLVVEVNEWLSAGWVAVLIAAYSVGAALAGRRLWWIGIISTAVVTGFIVVGIAVADVPWQSVLTTPVLFASAFTLGDNMRRRRERSAELVERAERAERERELLAIQQVQLERTRIARELHDVVAHSVSVMVIQAGAARRQLASHPDQARDALESIETAGREAMSEMRRVLGVLRHDQPGSDAADHRVAERAPQPSLASLGDLIAASTDLPVLLTIHDDLPPIPTAIELNAYRVVQEALTNVRRHAGKVDRVGVDVSHRDARLVVEVVDDGRGPIAGAAGHRAGLQAGYGLTGMRERVDMFGGELTAGANRGGGWRVRATFPLTPLAVVTV